MRTNIGNRVVPALLVRDPPETLGFNGRHGFPLPGCHPDTERPTWAEVRRDDVTLQFHTIPSLNTPDSPVFSGTLCVFPEDVSALAGEFRDKVDLAWGPEVMDYGTREFAIQDPDGYFLAFTDPP